MQSNLPITNLGIVADLSKCPPSYIVLVKSTDKREDCDLWKDSVFKSKCTRYLCFTRAIEKHQDHLQDVLVNIFLINDRDPVPEGCRIVHKTMDTCVFIIYFKKALQKKLLCIRMLPRNSTCEAVSDMIILSRNKKPPNNYTAIGEINGLVLCYQMCNLANLQQGCVGGGDDDPMLHTINNVDNSNNNSCSDVNNTTTSNALVYYNDIGSLVVNAMYDIPFCLNASIGIDDLTRNELLHLNGYKNRYDEDMDIETEFSYDFTVERMMLEL
ncbi:hypothetical protein HELRODRAFT_179523 [Helobdella robusta]|uniref:MABP domain-containing protein n=1 Tax=Helobdella robusta TaxID=6412 RepID=T1FEU4_HELRO|nr:hypothetical protein HELRODRAFT_179523 [Helobdella robusta]ESN95197.1 hypothetical protein HELRODRAFT_179523 [Helobdella robusta]